MEKILVIEDSKLMRQKIVDILEKMGCENIIQLNNADVIYNNPKFYMKNVKLLIIDIGLPGISGIELAKKLNSYPEYANIPIIFLTAHSEVNIVKEAIQSGATDFIVKPINEEIFEKRISKFISRFKGRSTNLYIHEGDIKEKIDIEYQRAVRSKQSVSFIILDLDEKYREKALLEIKSILRRIDMVNILKNKQILIILPITGHEGCKVVMDKIHKKLSEKNINLHGSKSITFQPESKTTVEGILEELKLPE